MTESLDFEDRHQHITQWNIDGMENENENMLLGAVS